MTETTNHFGGSPLLSEYDFRATCFYDGYMPMSAMADKIASELRFEKRLQQLHESKQRREN